MAEEKRDARSAEEAKGVQEEPQQGKPWTLVELWGKPRWDWMELLVVPFIVSLATASNSTRVKPPSSVLRSSSICQENQESTFLPFFLHASVTTGPPHAPRTYSAIRTGAFSALESEPHPWRTEPRCTC